jgi:hypothetical protein
VRRETILVIWAGGVVLAVALYMVGPDRFLDACLTFFDAIDEAFRNLALILGAQAYAVVRAVTIAFYFVFAVLALIAAHRGLHGVWALIVVTAALMILVWRPYIGGTAPISHWLASLIIILVGGTVMTQRLIGPPRRPFPPFPPNRTP